MFDPQNPDRRTFLQTAGVAALSVAAGSAAIQPAQAAERQGFRKAVKWGMIDLKGASVLEKFKLLKELGYDGVELNAPDNLDKKEVLAARDKTGLPIHGVVDSVHWKDHLSHPDPAVRSRGAP